MLRVTALLLPLPLAAPAPDPGQRPQVTIYRQSIVIRVPRMAPMRAAPIAWKEKKGPKCLDPHDLAGATVTTSAAVDLLLVDGRRMRARLGEECRSADFYRGLYLKPGADGRVCADRDAFRIRSGARCPIDEFRTLSPKR